MFIDARTAAFGNSTYRLQNSNRNSLILLKIVVRDRISCVEIVIMKI